MAFNWLHNAGDPQSPAAPDYAPLAVQDTPSIDLAQPGIAARDTLGSPVDPGTSPYDGIVTIVDEIGGKYWQGSGILLSPTEVLTASHVVWQTGQAVATNITVIAKNEVPYGGSFGGFSASGINVQYNPVDDSNGTLTFFQSQSDFAVIKLATPIYQATLFGLQAGFVGGDANITGYPGTGNGQEISDSGSFTLNPYYSILEGPGLGDGSSGGPVWLDGQDGQPESVGLVSTGDASTNTGYDCQLTNGDLAQIQSWLATDGASLPLTGMDTTTDQAFLPQLETYSGPVAGLSGQYIDISPDNLNLTANTASVFLHSGAGEDALQALSGNNVLDGGTGSNFLVGGSGSDTFFTDDRNAPTSIWDTLANFHAGDAATLFGVTQSGFNLQWIDGQGAAGYEGLTLHATAAGSAEASVTLSGYDSSALTNGQLTVEFGTTDGTPYMYIHANG